MRKFCCACHSSSIAALIYIIVFLDLQQNRPLYFRLIVKRRRWCLPSTLRLRARAHIRMVPTIEERIWFRALLDRAHGKAGHEAGDEEIIDDGNWHARDQACRHHRAPSRAPTAIASRHQSAARRRTRSAPKKGRKMQDNQNSFTPWPSERICRQSW